MPRVCTVCTHPDRRAIDVALARGEPNRRIATQLHLTEASVRRHAAAHLPATLVQAQAATETAHGINVVAQLKTINSVTLAILKEARDQRDAETALKAIGRLEAQITL